jgi:integrase
LKEVSARTVGKELALLGAVFATAVEGGRLAENPAAKVKVPVPRVNGKARLPFSYNDLERIVAALPTLDDEMRWIVLLGMMTGARIAEIAGLRPSDVRAENGTVYLEITGQLKTASSERKVPLHVQLIALGFLEYVAARKDKAHLFEVESDPASKRFGRWLRGIGITDPKLVFHSFRHGFITMCRHAGIDEEVRGALTGHVLPGVGRTYGLMPLSALAAAVAKLRFPS